MKSWKFKHKETRIEVTNGFRGETLIVDGELQDEGLGMGTRGRLYGKIRTGENQGKLIKVSLGGWLSIGCVAFIDDTEVFRS